MGKIVNRKQIPMLLLTVAFCAIALPVRLYLLWNNTEMESGFYQQNNIWTWGLYLVTFLAIAIPLLYNLKLTRQVTPFGCSRSRGIAYAGILFGIAMLYDFVNQTVTLFNLISGTGGNPSHSFFAQGGLPIIFQTVLALVGAFYIMIYAFSFFGGTLNYRNFKMIALFPAVWLACRLVRHFLVEINYLMVSQRLLEIFMLILAMIFFYNLAKLNACFSDGVKNWKLFGSGWGCVFLCMVLSVPRMAMWICGNRHLLPEIETSVFVDLAMGMFVFVYLIKGSVVRVDKQAEASATALER